MDHLLEVLSLHFIHRVFYGFRIILRINNDYSILLNSINQLLFFDGDLLFSFRKEISLSVDLSPS
jgi:hypothetical protein